MSKLLYCLQVQLILGFKISMPTCWYYSLHLPDLGVSNEALLITQMETPGSSA